MEKERCLKAVVNKNNLSFPRNVVGNLPLSESLVKEAKQPCFNRKVEDPRQKRSGMTSLFNNNNGFTLIELLIVVLIIGILAAIAVPQYQKAVAKSRAVQLITNAHTIRQALRLYYLTTGEKMSQMSQLDIWDSITPAAPNRYETATLNGTTFTYVTQSQTINFNIQFPGYHSWNCSIYPDGQRGFCYVYTEKDQSLAQSLGWDCSEKIVGVNTPWCNIGPNWNKL